jgi:hypothetical protein
MDWSDVMQKIYNFNNCFSTIDGRLYRQNSPTGIAVTVSTDTRLAPSSLTSSNGSVFFTFNNQSAIPFPVGTTVFVSGITGATGYNGTYSVATASITSSIATIGWSSSVMGSATISSSIIRFTPENNIVISSVAGLTSGMSVIGPNLTASVTISSFSTSNNTITLSQNHLGTVSAGQFLYIGRNTSINTNTPLECLNVYKRKVLSSGLTGDPTRDTIIQMQKAFEEAIAQSANSEEVLIVEDPTAEHRLCLITQSKQPKWNDDTKEIAIPFSSQMDVGKTIDWIRTGYKYLVMTQNLTQKAYFSGSIQQCNFLLNWQDDSGNIYSQYVVVDGPGEKDADWTKISNTMIDKPNWTIQIYIGKTNATQYLSRYSRIILNGYPWEIFVINNMENENILKISLAESFIKNQSDDVPAGLADNTNENVAELQSLILNDLS